MAEGLKIWGVSNYILILMKQGLLLNLPNYGGAIAPRSWFHRPWKLFIKLEKESTVHWQTNRPANKQYRKIPCYRDVRCPLPTHHPEKFTVTPVLDSLQRK